MELLDRYLQAVKFFLPKEQQADIVAELSEDLRSQIEDEQEALGRKLTEAELEGLLKRRGHPMWVAEPYYPPRHLIGSLLLPTYLTVLRWWLMGLAAVFVGCYVVFGVFLREAPVEPALREPFFWLWQFCLYALAAVGLFTVIFALFERAQARARATGFWDPARPHELPARPVDAETRRRQRMRASAVGEAVGCLIFLLWWVGAFAIPLPPELPFVLTPVWQSLYWPIFALYVVWIALAGVLVVRPRRTPLLSGIGLARDAIGLVLVALLLAAGNWLEVQAPAEPLEVVRNLARWININLAIVLAFVALSLAAKALQDGRALAGRAPLRHWALSLVGAD
jgi:hypothetical protein